jgi:hypothetical protein
MLGDVNGDLEINVLDIVQIVQFILNPGAMDPPFDECQIIYANYNQSPDGLVNVLDIVMLVGDILAPPSRSDLRNASGATLMQSDSGLSITADGYVGGVQLTLTHEADFSISLTNDAYLAEYVTQGNETRLIIIEPAGSELFTTSGSFEISEVIVASLDGAVETEIGTLPGQFSLSNAYPNPFNPSTTVQLNMPADGYASVRVYNLIGQVVATLVEGPMNAGYNQVTWNAENVPSGLYLIQAEVGNNTATQKVMLLK